MNACVTECILVTGLMTMAYRKLREIRSLFVVGNLSVETAYNPLGAIRRFEMTLKEATPKAEVT